MANKKSKEVSDFLSGLDHPLSKEIESLRKIILSSDVSLTENIKWNGPNYTHAENDRITMRIMPPKYLQLIFHRGAKKLAQPKKQLIADPQKLLAWKENDRAILTIKDINSITKNETGIKSVIKDWINACAE